VISGCEIRVNGTRLDPKLHDRLIDARIQDNLRLPDSLVVRFSDPGLENVDTIPLEIGADVEVLLAAIDATSLTSVFKGKISSLEPEFAATGTVLAARAYDGSQLLNQTKRVETYQNMTAGDVARKVAQKAGIKVGTIESAGPAHDFVQQNNETDWEFLWRLAGRIDFEVLVVDGKLHFRKAGSGEGGAAQLTLRWGEELLSFRPRLTGVQQVDEVVVRAWDPIAKQTIEETSKVTELGSTIGIARDSIVAASGRGKVTVADRPVFSGAEAKELAKSLASHLGNAYLEGDGAAKGNPGLRAGTKVTIEGVGTRFGGTYTVSSTTHVYRSAKGYETLFSISGRSPRSLVDLMTPAAQRGWGNSVVIGKVTQNDDPQGLGRVRVSYPALGDGAEGWWARVATPAAGKDRGLLMMPVVGDEVLVAFEHDDVHKPYVIGSVWNGKDTPGDLVQKDGSFALASDKNISVTAKDAVTIKSDKDFTVEAKGKVSHKADRDVSVESGTATISMKSGTSLTIEAGTNLTIKCGAAEVTMTAAGVVKVSGISIVLG
jgi:phage protein D